MNRLTSYGCLMLSMTLVGSYVALSRPLVAAFPVFLLAWLRFGIGVLAMPHWLVKPAGETPLSQQTRWLLFLESFIGNFLFSICMLSGVRMTSAVSAGVIMAAIPAVTAIMSWWFLKERIGLRVWIAIACAMSGILILAVTKQTETQSAGTQLHSVLLGNFFIFCAVLCESTYAILGKKLTRSLTPRRITALINLWGFILMTPPGIWAALHFDFGSVAGSSWLLLFFYAIAASVLTVWLWMTGLKGVPAGQSGVFTVMLPIAAAAVGTLVLGEQLQPGQLLAFVLALAGVVLAGSQNNTHESTH